MIRRWRSMPSLPINAPTKISTSGIPRNAEPKLIAEPMKAPTISRTRIVMAMGMRGGDCREVPGGSPLGLVLVHVVPDRAGVGGCCGLGLLHRRVVVGHVGHHHVLR